MKIWKLALLCVGVGVCALGRAFAGDTYVDVKEKAVGQNRRIDYQDEQIAHAVSMTPTNGSLVDVRSTIFRPPPYWVFLKFRDVPSRFWPMYVDIAESPEELKSWAKPDTAGAIGVNGLYIPPENAGRYPLRCEGNLAPTNKPGVGGGGGGLPSQPQPHHWSAKIDFWTNSIDLDVDSDNNNGVYGPPHRDEKEEKIEEGRPGKYLPKDDGDADEDLVQGFADGFGKFGSPSGDTNFVPVVVDVKNAGPIDWARARLKVICPMSDPSATVRAGTAEKPYHQAQGIFRLWTLDGKAERKPAAVDAKGHWIAPKEYAAKLLIDPQQKKATWYAEGIQEGGYEGEIAAEFDPLGTGEWLKDKVHVTVVHGDVDVDSDNDDGFNPPKRDRYEDRIEAAPLKFKGTSYPGKLIPLNEGDVDRDGVPDWADGFNVDPQVPADDRISTNAHLFVPIVFDLPEPLDPNKVSVRLRYPANDPRQVRHLPMGDYVLPPQGDLRIWRTNEWSRDKRSALENGDYVEPGVYKGGGTLRNWFRNGRRVTCWLEAVRMVQGAKICMEVDPDGTNGPAGWVHEDCVKVSVLKVDMKAYRPTTDLPAYGHPFAKHAVPDAQEETPGAGIRVNGDTESAANENDLIEVELKAEPYPTASGLTYVLKRNNSNIKVWDSQTMGTAILDSGTEATITFSAATKTVWVENPSGGTADLELIARSGSTDVCSDKVHFYPFTSIVIALGGEGQDPTDPANANHGIFQLAIDLYEQGYDVHMYNEDGVDTDGDGPVYNEVVSAIQNRNVTQVAIYGYSHGGGSTHDLAERLDDNSGTIGTFSVPFTAYIDAVAQPLTAQENRRPPGSAYHVNYYQVGVGNPLDPWFDYGLDGGPIDNPPGADHEVNVDAGGQTHTHQTIDDDANVLNGIESRLTPRVTR